MTAKYSDIPGQFIPLHYHYQMLMDQERMRGFRDAISYFLPDGGKLVDLGGGTGILSFFAAQKASHVWCVELNPELAETARRLIEINNCADRVEVVEADATRFVPPLEVDVVVCEMLHAAMLREKQIQVIRAFKTNYRSRFPGKLPLFVPEATLLALQAVSQDFIFSGYHAPVPIMFNPYSSQDSTRQLSEPVVYAMLRYHQDLSEQISWRGNLSIKHKGTMNALRFITKNVLAIEIEKNSAIDWHNFYMVLPLEAPLVVKEGDQVCVEFNYSAGGEVSELAASIKVSHAG